MGVDIAISGLTVMVEHLHTVVTVSAVFGSEKARNEKLVKWMRAQSQGPTLAALQCGTSGRTAACLSVHRPPPRCPHRGRAVDGG